MAKAKCGKPKTTTETEPGPRHLLASYVKHSKEIGIDPCKQLVEALQNSAANGGKQIILVGRTNKEEQHEELKCGGCRAFVNALIESSFTATEEIRICGHSLGDQGAVSISNLLSATATATATTGTTSESHQWNLNFLELISNGIGPRGAQALGRSLEVANCSTLATLILDFNPITSAGAALLCRGLSSNSHLKSLSLNYCNLDGSCGSSFGSVLAFKR